MIQLSIPKMISAGVVALAMGLMFFSFTAAEEVTVTVTPDVLSVNLTNATVAFPDTALSPFSRHGRAAPCAHRAGTYSSPGRPRRASTLSHPAECRSRGEEPCSRIL